MRQYSMGTLWFSCENLTRSLSFVGFSINSCESNRMAELIMIVEDEAGVRELLRDTLRIAGFETVEADNGMSALTVLRSRKPDLMIIDINMPLMDGFELVERLRATGDLVPVLMLTARNDQQDIARGLTLGADDYVVKPFGLEELILRVKAIVRRSKKTIDATRILKCGPITLDEELHKVTFDNDEINLSPTEFRLLQMLIEKKGRVLSKVLLLDEVWGITFESESTVVDTYISYLRKKLHRDGFEGIRTVRGVGFQINEPKEIT
jgi:two-component system, OmpR family, response regulator